MKPTLDLAIAAFGAAAKEKLANPAVTGQPEDQLRAPFERLLADLSQLLNFSKSAVAAVGESSVSDLKTRPDYAVTVHKALVGFIELKAPGKGADPRKFKDPHDKAQWDKLHSLPNLIYTDGNAFSLWQNGELVGSIVKMDGDVESSGSALKAPIGLISLFENFLHWQPIPPKNAKALAETTARLCRLLREEVTEQLGLKSPVLTGLAEDWRKLLFPDASDERFADGYAQAVTFGLLMARAKNITLETGLQQVASELSKTSTLVGAALKLLTDDAQSQATLKTSLGTLTRVLDAVNWSKISRDKPDAWLYFYEDFLEVYDNQLRKQTGSYYTPPEVVGAMVELADEALKSRFGLHAGLASPSVTLADPAVGTGTFLLGVLRKIADTVKADEGEGAVKAAINATVKRLIAFEMQLGPFAVAQLRILAEIVDLTGGTPKTPLRMFVTDTLGNPHDDEGYFPQIVAAIANSRKEANKIKRDEPITVVIGNPPYKEKSKGLGGWIEGENSKAEKSAPLSAWAPPPEWGAGAHSKHLRNLYIYFWRWATWKVYDHGPGSKNGIVCFITVAGFLGGPGFEKMRDYLRRTCNDIWVIDCSPEGHQPSVSTRIFQGVQQPVCIVLASRSANKSNEIPAQVRFQALPVGNRLHKFEVLSKMTLTNPDWIECPSAWRAPFLPASTGAWAEYPKLEGLFVYDGSGCQPKRTWVIAPDAESLIRRWDRLIAAPAAQKEELFHATLRDGQPADRHIRSIVQEGIPGYSAKTTPIIDENGACVAPVPYGFRSFNRQWIIPDSRVITQPNAELWESRSNHQVYLTALTRSSPTSGPAVTFTALVPDLDHYKGSFGGRVYPLWRDREATTSNVSPVLLSFLSQRYGLAVTPEDVMAYIAAIVASPAFTARFQSDLSTPGLRVPITADVETYREASELGRTIIWLHTFGERMVNPDKGRPPQPPRLPAARRPRIPVGGEIPQDTMPDTIDYDVSKRRLIVGAGYIENVDLKVWEYEVSGKQVLGQWFSYRRANRDRPIIGERRRPSPLGDIQPNHWLSEYTTELLNVLNVLGLLIDLEAPQTKLLDQVCSGETISETDLQGMQSPTATMKVKRPSRKPKGPPLSFG
jgi:hypothetical protein